MFKTLNCETNAAAIAKTHAFYGAGTGPISLDEVACTSSQTSLLQCTSNSIVSHDCTHSEDAGVQCEGKSTLYAKNNNSFSFSSMFHWRPETGRRECGQ